MNADQPNLVNGKDSTYKIDSVSGTNQQLAANQWGYGMGKDATTFNPVSSATLADVTSDSKGNCISVDDCTLYLTFGANLDQKRLPTGNYSTSLTYTATSKPVPYVPPTPAPEPPKPKWTTNGCYYSGDNWRNCGSFTSPGNTVPVVWKNNSWYAIDYTEKSDWFYYNTYYNTTWAHAAILTESGEQKNLSMYSYGSTVKSVKLDLDDIVKIFAYVPVYVKRNNHIDFCRSIDDKCKYNNVTIDRFGMDYFNQAIDHFHDNGFWISTYAMGCTNAPDESKCKGDSLLSYSCNELDILSAADKKNKYNIVSSDSIRSDAKKIANTLAEALGSPCY